MPESDNPKLANELASSLLIIWGQNCILVFIFGLSKCDPGKSSGGSGGAGVMGRLQKSKGMRQHKGGHQKEKSMSGTWVRSEMCETHGHIKLVN